MILNGFSCITHPDVVKCFNIFISCFVGRGSQPVFKGCFCVTSLLTLGARLVRRCGSRDSDAQKPAALSFPLAQRPVDSRGSWLEMKSALL